MKKSTIHRNLIKTSENLREIKAIMSILSEDNIEHTRKELEIIIPHSEKNYKYLVENLGMIDESLLEGESYVVSIVD